jgi:hypothetical protein
MFFEKMFGVHWNIGAQRDYKTLLYNKFLALNFKKEMSSIFADQ